MKKFLVSFSLFALFAIYAIYERVGGYSFAYIAPGNNNKEEAVRNKPIEKTASDTDMVSAAPLPKKSAGQEKKQPAQTKSPRTVSGNAYGDGAYTGSVADAYYGNVEVQAIIQGGKIADIKFLQYPNDRRTSIEINTKAIPQLKSEAISIQSAEVDVISGATQTTAGFKESLASALATARAAR